MPNPQYRSTLASDWLIWRDLCATGPATARYLAESSSRTFQHVTNRLGIMAKQGHVVVVAVKGSNHERVYTAATEPLPHPKHGGSDRQPDKPKQRQCECLLAQLWTVRLPER